jgi:hypothetical protein
MAYIGKQPVVGNFQKCDAISVVNGQAAYTLNVGGAAVTPENANHMLVSLNGVLQAPGDSFTVSGSTLTFASNLATGDVIDFVIILGDVLDLGTPSDNSITTAKLASDAVTEAKIADDAVESEHLNNNIISGQTALGATPADTDELLVSDAGTLKRVDFSYLKGGGQWEFISETTAADSAQIDFTTFSTDFKDFCFSFQDIHPQTDDSKFCARFFQGTGGSQAIEDGSSYHFAIVVHDNQVDTDNGTSANKMEITREMGGTVSTESISGETMVYNVHGTTHHKMMKTHGVVQGSDTGRTGVLNSAGKLVSTSAITGIRFFMLSGNIQTGKIAMYGRKRT